MLYVYENIRSNVLWIEFLAEGVLANLLPSNVGISF
jgi:hypothetical protein